MDFRDKFLKWKNNIILGDKMRNKNELEIYYYFMKKTFPINKNKTAMLNKHIPFSTFVLEKVDIKDLKKLIEKNDEILERTKDW